jgi:hypothetical protein
MRLILGLHVTRGTYRSGICHHIVIVKEVISDMISKGELFDNKRYGDLLVNKTFWEICLIERFISESERFLSRLIFLFSFCFWLNLVLLN